MKTMFVSEVSKRLTLAFAAIVMTFATAAAPLMQASAQSGSVLIEGYVRAANLTAGATSYSDSVNANVGDTVEVQVWYHNRELFDSNKLAKNLSVALNVPEAHGKVQTLSGTIKGDNTNTVNDSATVNLAHEQAYLDYVEGSAKWSYNKGAKAGRAECQQKNNQDKTPVPANDPHKCYTTETIDDKVVNGGVVLEDAKPCYAYKHNVTVKLKVMKKTTETEKPVETPEKPSETPETPQPKEETPAEIPATGAASVMAGVLGVSGLTYAAASYVASRRFKA